MAAPEGAPTTNRDETSPPQNESEYRWPTSHLKKLVDVVSDGSYGIYDPADYDSSRTAGAQLEIYNSNQQGDRLSETQRQLLKDMFAVLNDEALLNDGTPLQYRIRYASDGRNPSGASKSMMIADWTGVEKGVSGGVSELTTARELSLAFLRASHLNDSNIHQLIDHLEINVNNASERREAARNDEVELASLAFSLIRQNQAIPLFIS